MLNKICLHFNKIRKYRQFQKYHCDRKDNFSQKYNYQRLSTILQVFQCNKFNYVKLKDIEKVKQQYKEQGFLKVFSKACGFFIKQAGKDFKTDFEIFKKIKAIPQNQRTSQQKYQYRKIKIDMIKFGPAFCVFNVPFGFPIFYLYLKLFPRLIPSWMMIDTLHEKVIELRQKRRLESWKFYIENFKQSVILPYLKQAIFKQNQSLQDLRRISCICYGDYMDGTQYLSQKTGLAFQNGLLLPKLSIIILKIQLRNELSHDYQLENQLKNLNSFEQKLYFKLTKQINKIQSNVSQVYVQQ